MSRAMGRWMVVGALAFAAAGVVGDNGSATADAAPIVSPFAGTYSGGVPGSTNPSGPSWLIGIGGNGVIYGASTGFLYVGELKGRVADDGTLSVSGTDTYSQDYDPTGGKGHLKPTVNRFKFSARVALDGAGNLTYAEGGAILWTRQ